MFQQHKVCIGKHIFFPTRQAPIGLGRFSWLLQLQLYIGRHPPCTAFAHTTGKLKEHRQGLPSEQPLNYGEDKMSSSYVKTLNKNNWLDALEKASKDGKLLVMEFMASWSEPSRLMSRIVANTIAPASEFKDKVDFCMLDIDEFMDLSRYLRVEALPTFVLVRDYYVKKSVVGVDKDELLDSIRQFMTK
ncbi:hypothetical protein BS78_05G172700 [Paspalum vaginatum]|nr:hypothetical protein BS78_05G172700 [Paspalum vaginatum]